VFFLDESGFGLSLPPTYAWARKGEAVRVPRAWGTPDTRPSVFLTEVMGNQTWEEFWTTKVEEARQSIQAYVWQGEILPTGRPAPAEAVPGASYVIVTPMGRSSSSTGTLPTLLRPPAWLLAP
jgi:hypothetical protein